ncbi:hypothetical protein KY290_006016 [Solanum tuberosum]|uniref:BZIP domain-containing protein n=1 Tax=Solanum tuberosum TaxID=4113 RepID=A0ABQ7WFS8_SOLTU|nr:hypothetical protein KY290_006016 [Solanum tuberosum]
MNTDFTCQTTPSCTAAEKFSGELVECEWEAAEALTCLSDPVARDHTAGEIEFSVDADDARITEQGIAIRFEDAQEVAIQAGYESELKTSIVCDLNYPPPVTRRTSRQELTEAEKEERRMRRVLANRESAKRTIHRRQAMREEMRRKADDLALENENLKKIKELAAAEYKSLKNKNSNLRMQLAKNVKTEVEETDDDCKSTLVETLTSATSTTSLHNQVPLVLSTVLPCFDGLILQSGTQSISSITPLVMMNAAPETPLYIVSFPWQMQFHAQSYPFHSWTTSYPNDQHKTSLVHECSTSTPKTTNMENCLNATPPKVETETPDSIDTLPIDFLHCNTSRDFRLDEVGQLSGFRSTSSPLVLPPVIARQNEIIQQHIYTPDFKVTYSDVGPVAGASTEMHQEHVTCSNNASAEARRKWKALMK